MSVTLRDIARLANVSVSTVSRVINNDTQKPASPKTAEKVWEIVRELNYIPNQTARNLVQSNKEVSTNAHRSIACILLNHNDLHTDPFFSEVIAGIHMEAASLGYVMEYTIPIPNSDNTKSAFFNTIVSRKVNGAILLGRTQQDTYEMLKNHIPHLVYCGFNPLNLPITQVVCDARLVISDMVDYLIMLGHKNIGFLGDKNEDSLLINEWRFPAFCKRMTERNMTLNPDFLHHVDLSLQESYDAMTKIIKKGCLATAYCCANDVVAIGAIKAALDLGISVPDEISFIGFGNIEYSSFFTPTLTTMHVYKKEMGRQAVNVLIDGINTKNNIPIIVNTPYNLVERNSTQNYKLKT